MYRGMPDRSRKPPPDPNQIAKFIVDAATGAGENLKVTRKEKNPAAVALGRLGGRKGGEPGLRKCQPLSDPTSRRRPRWLGGRVSPMTMPDDPVKAISEVIVRVSEKRDCDVLAFFGDIDRKGADRVLSLIKKRKCKRNLVLMLATFGGDAHAAYKISRTLQNQYSSREQFREKTAPKFSVFVPTYCKSAGTILILGADEIIMAPEAELGPIDVQLRKQDEIGEMTSGLTPNQSIRSLTRHAEDLFKSIFRRLRFDNQLGFSTKMASDIAASLTANLLNPVFGQMDPLRMGETERMLEISVQYGKRLAVSNLRSEELLTRLVTGYPSHGFVIDLPEAREIFRVVSEQEQDLIKLAELFEVIWSQSINRDEAFIYYIDADEIIDAQDPAPTNGAQEADAQPIQDVTPDAPQDANGGPNGEGPAHAGRLRRRVRPPLRPGPASA